MSLPADIKDRLDSLSPAQRAAFLKQLQERRRSSSPASASTAYGLSAFQKRVWTAVHATDTASQTYNIHAALFFEQGFHIEPLEQALRTVLSANAVLRSIFYEKDGRLWQEPQDLQGWQIDRRVTDNRDIWPAVNSTIDEVVSKSFNLARDFLFCATTVQGPDSASVLILSFHHIVCDGLSLQFFVSDVEAHYNTIVAERARELNHAVPLSEIHGGSALPITSGPKRLQFRDFVGDTEATHGDDLDYWLHVFKDPPERIDTLAQKPRPAKPDYEGASRSCHFDLEVVSSLKALCKEHRVSMFMAVLTLTQTLLGRIARVDESTIGVPVAGRQHVNADGVIGPFVNTVAIRQPFDPSATFIQALTATRQTVLNAMRHQYLPFETLISALPYAHDYSRGPLFDVMLGLTDDDEQLINLNGSQARFIDIPCRTSKVDLTFHFSVSGKAGLKLELEYSCALFTDDYIERLLTLSQGLLKSLVSQPQIAVAQASLASTRSVTEFLHAVNQTFRELPAESRIASRYHLIARQYPSCTALVTPDRTVTYQQLDEAGDRIAHYLINDIGCETGEAVAVLLEKDERPIMAMLGILKANACYVPLAADTPIERIELAREASAGRFLLSDKVLAGRVVGSRYTVIDIDAILNPSESAADPVLSTPNVSHSNSPPDVLAEHSGDGAYIMFTSGTTGQPKGVLISQRSILRLVCNTDFHQVTVGERVLLTGSLAFDAATFEIWGPLLNGGTVCIPAANSLLDMQYMHELIEGFGIDTAFMTTGLLNQVVSQNLAAFSSMKTVLTGGEKISVAHISRLMQAHPCLDVIHVYGPTENTTFSTWHRITDDDLKAVTVPIGRPIANSTVLLLDDAFNAVPKGVPGELYCGGEGVALGYLGPLEAQSKFVNIPGFSGRFYRTGDLGRWTADGAIEFIGRNDRQVKIRGFRIELGEIEFHLRAIEGIDNAFVTSIERESKKELVAYWVATVASALTDTTIRSRLREKVPAYMVPTHLVQLDVLPLNANGKVDSRALPSVGQKATDTTQSASSEGDMLLPNEVLLVDWLAETLSLDTDQRCRLRRADNFFALGGDSILAIQLVALARKAGCELALQSIFQTETLAELAAEITLELRPEYEAVSSARTSGPQTPVQQWWLERLGGVESHFNLSAVLRGPSDTSHDAIEKSLSALVAHHSALRISLDAEAGTQRIEDVGRFAFETLCFDAEPSSADRQLFWEKTQRAIDVHTTRLLSAGLIITPTRAYLGLVIHHIAVDEVSSQIYLDHFRRLYQYHSLTDDEQITTEPPSLTSEDSSSIDQALALQRNVESGYFEQQLPYWSRIDQAVAKVQHSAALNGERVSGRPRQRLERMLPKSMLESLQELSLALGGSQIPTLLLASLAHAWDNDLGAGDFAVMLEHNGRSDFGDSQGSLTTTGWFTSLYPFIYKKTGNDLWETLRTTRDLLRSIPDSGLGYLALRYKGEGGVLSANPLVSFNYLGDLSADENATFPQIRETCGPDHGAHITEPFALDILAWSDGGQLYFSVIAAADALTFAEDILTGWQSQLETLPRVQQERKEKGEIGIFGISDYPFTFADNTVLDAFLECYALAPSKIETIMPVTPMQEGMLLHAISGGRAYYDQVALRLNADIDTDYFAQAVEQLIKETALLRTGFARTAQGAFVQVVHSERLGVFSVKQLSDGCIDGQQLEHYRITRREPPQDLLRDPLITFELIQLQSNKYELLINFHHAVMDGWSSGLVLERLESIYRQNTNASDTGVGRLGDMVSYFNWLHALEAEPALAYWQQLLVDYHQRLRLPSSRPRLAAVAEHSESFSIDIDQDLYAQIQQFCAAQGVTVSSYFQALWGITVASYTGSYDVVFGATVSGRDVPVADIEHIAGMLINTVPVRVSCAANMTVSTLVKAVARQFSASLAHSRAGLADIQRQSGAKGGLISHTVVFENYPETGLGADGWQWSVESVYDPMQYDFGVIVAPKTNSLGMRFVYDPACYLRQDMAVLARRVTELMHTSLTQDCTVDDLIALGADAPKTWSISANFSADPIVETLQFYEQMLGLSRAVCLCPYDQVIQQLINPDSERARSGAARHVILWRPVLDLNGMPDLIDSMAQLSEILEACRSVATTPGLDIALLVMPWWQQDQDTYDRLHEFLLARCQRQNNLHTFSLSDLATRYGVVRSVLPPEQVFGDIPYHEHFYAALGAELSRWADKQTRKPTKVIAVDADNTLWQGVVGEDGVEGVVITEQHLFLQQRLLAARAAGVLLCVVSKNNPEDLNDIFTQREMPLRLEHLTRVAASWQPKSNSILELSDDLSLGLDSFVFIDDSPMECAEVKSSCPGVSVINLPEDWSETRFIEHLWLLDTGASTDEDRRRADMYKQELARVEERKKTSDFAAFVAALDLDIQVDIAQDADFERLSQLSVRTNQFNTSGIKFDAAQLANWSDSQTTDVLSVRVSDRYGDYGLVGCLVTDCLSSNYVVRVMMLSCRVLGRSVEHAILRELATRASALGHTAFYIACNDLPRNQPARAFIANFGSLADETGDVDADSVHQFTCKDAASWAIDTPSSNTLPSEALPIANSPATPATHTTANADRERFYAYVAEYLYSAAAIIDQQRLLWGYGTAGAADAVASGLPATAIEETVATWFHDLLGVDHVYRASHFFELGGQSVKLMMLLARVQQHYGISLDYARVLALPTVSSIATQLTEDVPGNRADVTTPTLTPLETDVIASPGQRRLWVLQDLLTDQPTLHMSAALQFEHALEPTRLTQVISVLLARHESLRTSLFCDEEGVIRQSILSHVSVNECFQQQKSTLSFAVAMTQLQAFCERPFNLQSAPLFRVLLLHLTEGGSVLAFTFHHVIADGWSTDLITEQFATLYNDPALHSADVLNTREESRAFQYRDYAVWITDWQGSEAAMAARTFWGQLYATLPQALELPKAYPRPARRSGVGNVFRYQLSKRAWSRLQAGAKAAAITAFSASLAVLQLALSRLSGEDDFSIGTVVTGRAAQEFEHVIGFFANVIPLRSQVDWSLTAQDLFCRTQQHVAECLVHSLLPFDDIIAGLSLERDASRTPLFDVLFAYQSDVGHLDFNDNTARNIDLPVTRAQYELTLNVFPEAEHFYIVAEYDCEIHSEETVELICRTFETIASAIPADLTAALSELPWVSERDLESLVAFEGVMTEPVQRTLPELVYTDIETKFGRLRDDNITWSYPELRDHSSRIARALLGAVDQRGQSPRQTQVIHVGVLGTRSLHSIAALIGVMQAGWAYVPLDPKQPVERLLKICETGSIDTLLITDASMREVADTLQARRLSLVILDVRSLKDTSRELPIISADSVAYTLFTSGTTGVPKGVSVSHAAFSSMIAQQIPRYDVLASDTCALFASFSFDASLSEMFLALCTGASLTIASDNERENPEQFLEWLRSERITVATLPPAFLRVLDQVPLAELRVLITAGEAAYPDDLRHYAKTLHVVNGYGPTEAAVCATAYTVDPVASWPFGVPIGSPLEGIRVSVRNDAGQRVSAGVVGELFIAGSTLAEGYYQDPDKTHAMFVSGLSDEPTIRWYKTGDLVRWRTDGSLEFFGRRDQQLKVRGHRIEAGEIEAVARLELPGADACVLLTDRGLVLFVAAANLDATTTQKLKQRLNASLPIYMRPAAIHTLRELPRSIAGKVDRKALLAQLPEHESEHAIDYTDTERQLAQLWSQALNIETIRPSDDFFELGGDSIKAMRVMTWLRREGYSASLNDFYDCPLLADFAATIGRDSGQITTASTFHGELPLLPIQQWFLQSRTVETAAHFNLAIDLQLTTDTTLSLVAQASDYLINSHPSLRAQFTCRNGNWRQIIRPQSSASGKYLITQYVGAGVAAETAITGLVQEAFNLESDSLFRCLVSGSSKTNITRLVLVAHHLVADWVSLRVLIDELDWALQQLEAGAALEPTEQPALLTLAQAREQQLHAWIRAGATGLPGAEAPGSWPRDLGQHNDLQTAHLSVVLADMEPLSLDRAEGDIVGLSEQRIVPALLQRFINALDSQQPRAGTSIRVMLERHGRHDSVTNSNGCSQTLDNVVGWLTQANVVEIPPSPTQQMIGDLLACTHTAETPDLFMSIYSPHRPPDVFSLPADISFNYLGDFSSFITGSRLQLNDTVFDGLMAERSPVDVALSVEIYRLEQTLEVQFSWLESHYDNDLMTAVIERFSQLLQRG